jgi:hypothetical protein
MGVNQMPKKISINRAPVLTLWAATVAERLGHDHEEALTLGKAEKEKEKKQAKAANLPTVTLLGRAVPVVKTPAGLRAAVGGEQIEPESVEKYLRQKFGEGYTDARAALEHLAKSYTPRQLEANAYSLYEKFRPEIPEGKKGWGARGELDLDYIASLAK